MSDQTFDLIQKHLEPSDYAIVASQDSAPNDIELRAVGAALGCELPGEFVEHSTNYFGGLYVEVKEELWPRPKPFDVGPFWTFLYGLYTLNIGESVPEFMDLALQAEQFRLDTGLTAAPFLKIIGDADVYCFDEKGSVVRYDHELNELKRVDQSFFEVLDFELGELADRKKRKTAGPME